MTPHLHPRSRLTTSLFGTTLLVSFLVVGMPHILPCPAPRVRFADAELGALEDEQRRRRQRNDNGSAEDEIDISLVSIGGRISEEEKARHLKRARQCPVPKPRGIVGEVLGFTDTEAPQQTAKPQIEPRKSDMVQEKVQR